MNHIFSDPPMNLTIRSENPLWLHIYFYAFGSVSFLINMLTVYCILKKSSKDMKMYKWFLFNIWFWSFVMDWVVMFFFQPISWFPLFGGACSMKKAALWNKDLVFMLIMIAGASLTNCTMSIVAGIFYRWQVLYPQSVFLETPQRTITTVIFIHVMYLTPDFIVMWLIRPTELMDQFIRYHVLNAEELLEFSHIVFHRDITENANIAIATFSFGIISVLLTCGAMLADSYRRLFLLKTNMISEKSKKMHTQMLLSLLMQAVIPTAAYATPICAACLMVLLDFKTEHMQEHTTYMIAVFCTHSTASCIVLLASVKCYRGAVIKMFHLKRFIRRNNVDASVSVSSEFTRRW